MQIALVLTVSALSDNHNECIKSYIQIGDSVRFLSSLSNVRGEFAYSDVSRYVTYCHSCANQRFICWRNNACYCSVAGKFEYQKKYDVNVCKQETSLYS